MPTVIIANPVNEGQSASLTVAHYDKDGVLTIPASIRYRIDDPDTLRNVREWTSLTPASSYAIALTRSDNVMANQVAGKERRKVTVEPISDADIGGPCDCVYEISKLQFYP